MYVMKNKTILAVDDVGLNLDILCSLLVDYDILTAISGLDALEIVKNEHIDLIILDIVMPDMDGYEVCQKIKQDIKIKDIPILFITANTDEASIEKAYEVGGVDYITKPFKVKELLARVAIQLDLADKTNNLEKLISTQVDELRTRDALLIKQSKKAEMGQMIATIAHQLKQPLNVISAMMSSILIDKMINADIDIELLCTKVQEETTFMAEIIDMYRTFFSTNKEKKDVYLKKVINDTLNILDGNTLNITFIKDYNKDLKTIKIYPSEIMQCILNIIKNAQDNQDEKKIKSKVIKISIFEDNDYQIITIHDNGGGVPEKIKSKIFENYFTTKSEETGTGIGLHLVKQIVEDNHNGKVYVENEELKYNNTSKMGAKFIIKLQKAVGE